MPFPNYTISTETANDAVNDHELHDEIVAAGPYTTTFEGVLTDRDADVVTTMFDATPSPGDQAIVTAVVAAHQGLAVEPDFVQVNDQDYVIRQQARIVDVISLSAPRVATLFPAASVPAGTKLCLMNSDGSVGVVNTLTLSAAGADLINGLGSLILNTAFASAAVMSDGVSAWTVA